MRCFWPMASAVVAPTYIFVALCAAGFFADGDPGVVSDQRPRAAWAQGAADHGGAFVGTGGAAVGCAAVQPELGGAGGAGVDDVEEWEATEEISSAGGGGSGESGRWGGGGGERTEHTKRGRTPEPDAKQGQFDPGGKTAYTVRRSYPALDLSPVRREGSTGPERPQRRRPDGQECYVESRLAGAKRRRTGKGEETGMPTGRPPGELSSSTPRPVTLA